MHDVAGDTLPPTCIQMIRDCLAAECGADFLEGYFYLPSDIDHFNVPADAYFDRCPPPRIIGILFFVSFTLLCGYILLNLIIAIVLDNFQSSREEEKLPIKRIHLQSFVDAWSQFDPSGTTFISARKLPGLIMALDPPMGTKGTRASLADVQMIIMTSDIPNRNGKVHFMETLHALSARIVGTDLPAAAHKKVEKQLRSKLPKSAETIKYTVAHYHAVSFADSLDLRCIPPHWSLPSVSGTLRASGGPGHVSKAHCRALACGPARPGGFLWWD